MAAIRTIEKGAITLQPHRAFTELRVGRSGPSYPE
jgi:hypothetical protein